MVAAIQAARSGAKTMVVERGSQLSGTMTIGGVAFTRLFFGWVGRARYVINKALTSCKELTSGLRVK